MTNAFDPKRLAIGPDVVAAAAAANLSKDQQRKMTWAQIPHHRGLELAKRAGNPMLAVLLALEHAIHAAKSNKVKLTNALLKHYGISHQTKARGLRQLAAAGVVTFKQDGKAAPVVTHLWYTKSGKLKVV
jgi:DNA-binding transcriptional ArsR family regulator